MSRIVTGWRQQCQRLASLKHVDKRLLLGLLLMFSYGGVASAEGLAVSCARNSGYYQFFDTATIEIGKDSAVGDVLGPWINSYNSTAWNCTPNSAYQQPVQFSVQGYPPYTTRNTIVVDGQTYMLYNTTVKAGLGISSVGVIP